MEPSLSIRNCRKIRGREAADRCESSVKTCHVISHVTRMTPEIRTLGRFQEREPTILSGAPRLIASKSDFRFHSNVMADELLCCTTTRQQQGTIGVQFVPKCRGWRSEHDLLFNASQ